MAYAPPEWAGSAYPSLPPQRRERVLLRFGSSWTFNWLHLDLTLMTLWFIVTAAQFRYDELLLYPLALYFTGMFFWRKDVTWPVFQRGFLPLLLPVWWILSTAWSPEPMLAFRTGLQSLLTILICMYVASRLNTRQFMAVIMIAMTVLAFRCLPQSLLDFSLGKDSKAIYAHKNLLGIAMSVFFATTLAMLFSAGAPKLLRAIALAMAPIALFLVFASQSATAILITVGISGIILGALLFLGGANRLTAGRILIALAIVVVAAVVAALALNFMQDDPVDLVLGALGKERNLTGRTDLWEIGAEQMKQRPFFGVGAHGYWRYDESADVRQIFFDYHKKRGNTFYFHNSWLEIGVAFGWIGIVLAASAVGWALGVLIRRAFMIGGSENWALLAIAIAIMIRTMTESDLFNQFNMLHMLFWSGALIRLDDKGAPAARRGQRFA